MKKLAVIFTVFLCVTAFSTQAMAYFEGGNLILSMYNYDGNEVSVDLGNIDTLMGYTNETLSVDFSGADFGVSDMSTISIGLSGQSTTGYAPNWKGYFGTTTSTINEGEILSGLYQNFNSRATGMNTLLTNTTSNVVSMSAGTADTYAQGFNQLGNVIGTYDGLYSVGSSDTEGQLGNGYVDMYLHEITWYIGATGVTFDSTANVMAVRIFDDGSVVINAADAPEVPVPGSLILLSSGLLGLVGIRRKKA